MAAQGIGIVGCGVVGQGVVDILQAQRETLERAAGPYELVGVAVRDPSRRRGNLSPSLLTTPDALLSNSQVQVLVEVAGGVEAPFQWVTRALKAGKAVVTANKALLAERAEALHPFLSAPDARLYCEAAVAGGIPIIQALDRGLVANRILRVEGILNGTCNYLLTQMERSRLSFAEALAQAQAKGFAEADPTLDISGGDSAHKLAVLASLALGMPISSAKVACEGIQRLTPFDSSWAERNGFRIKMLAQGLFTESSVELRVHPTLVPRTHLISEVMDEFNAVALEGDLTGPQLYEGRGAGSKPTASAVVADIVQALRKEPMIRSRPRASPNLRFIPLSEVVSRHYVHLEVIDRPGVVAKVASALARYEISIASMFQPEVALESQVPLVFTTHPAKDAKISSALEEMGREKFLTGQPVRIRMEA